MQEMSENFIDSFGFQDDEFTESEENVSRGMRKLNSVNFLMQTDDSTKQAIFDSVCEQRIQAFSTSPTGESTSPDPWADRTAELTFGAGAESKAGDRVLNIEEAQAKLSRIAAAEASSSSDEEEQDMAPPDRMEVDNEQDPWETIEGPVEGSVAMDTSSPWGQESAETTAASSPWGEQSVQAAAVVEQQEATGWADFGAFSGGGEGMEGKMEQMESTDRLAVEEKEGWSPAMVSSPEATMLEDSKDIKGEEEAGVEAEQSNRDDGGASPLLEERLQPVEMQGAVEVEKTIGDSATVDQKKADSIEAVEVVVESAVAPPTPTGEREDGAS